MKNATLKNKWVIASMVAALGYSVNGAAHDQVGALGNEASATDHYLIICSTEAGEASDVLEVRVFDATEAQGGGKISAVVQRESVVRTASDPFRVDKDFNHDKNFGPLTSVSGGNGAYNVMVHKLKTSPKSYLLEYHCKTNSGIHTGTSLTVLQDQ